MNFKEDIEKALKKIVGKEVSLEIPPNMELGDFSLPCFQFAKQFKKNPTVICKELADQFKMEGIQVNPTGPYLNFFVDKGQLAEGILRAAFKKDYGKGKTGKTVVIDYGGPNVAKHMGIHNLRSTVIGQSLCNLYRFAGFKVVGINHLGDWGTNFGHLIAGIKKYSKLSEIKTVQDLNKIYVKYHKAMEKNKELEDEARAEFKKLEKGNKEAKKYWSKFVEVSMKDYDRIFERLGVKFDSVKGESEYTPLIDDTLKKLKKFTRIDDGALVIDVGKDMPPCLLKKTDGSTLYATRDITAGLYRQKYKPWKVLYVVDVAQAFHFRQWFNVMGQLNDKYKDMFVHVQFGRLSFKDKAMSTRKGLVVVLEDVLDKAVSKVKEIIKEKNPKLKNKAEVAEAVGVGAVIFNDLFNDRIHNIIFDWDRVLDFEGDTGPYVQYAHARSSSVLRKAKIKASAEVQYALLNEDAEVTLIKRLGEFPKIIEDSVAENKPSVLAKYLTTLARDFNNFYRCCQVIIDDKEMMKARLLLTYCAKKTLSEGMDLLNIKHPDEM